MGSYAHFAATIATSEALLMGATVALIMLGLRRGDDRGRYGGTVDLS